VPTTLVVTNDFPPRIGGIESFVREVCDLLDHDVVVLTSRAVGDAAHDAALPYPVVRQGRVLLPTAFATRTAVHLLRSSGASRVVFGAAAPLSAMAPALRQAGAHRILGLSHGHETWWATVPGARRALRRMVEGLDHLATISDYAERRIAAALTSAARERLVRLPPPVDTSTFHPEARAAGPPRCVAVGRFVAQKGFAALVRSWRVVLQRWPYPDRLPELVLVGDGPQRRSLAALVQRMGLADTVTFTGPLRRDQVVAQLQAADVFALPVRTRLAGLNPEGLGLGFLEAAACGLPVVVGASGGAPETVLPGESGYVVRPNDVEHIADRILQILIDPDLARRMGRAGRQHVTRRYSSGRARRTLHDALEL
jgi:phosphatidylinositol alpha-1,6-mannosyltransferase